MSTPSGNCCIFLDHSNIYAGAQKMAVALEGEAARAAVRLEYDSLVKLAAAGRPITTGVCVGSLGRTDRIPLGLFPASMQVMESAGIGVEIYERSGNTRTEQAVDQAIQVHMLRAMADHPPGVAVLVSGDGAGYQEGKGFMADLERMQRMGWGIELLAWNTNCNRRMRDWADEDGCFVPLDNYYYSICSLRHVREADELLCTDRVVATPGDRAGAYPFQQPRGARYRRSNSSSATREAASFEAMA